MINDKPQIVECLAGAWTPVATGVYKGYFHYLDKGVECYFTYRKTGGTAPVDTELTEAVPLNEHEEIGADELIDIYVYTTKTCNVRVDV